MSLLMLLAFTGAGWCAGWADWTNEFDTGAAPYSTLGAGGEYSYSGGWGQRIFSAWPQIGTAGDYGYLWYSSNISFATAGFGLPVSFEIKIDMLDGVSAGMDLGPSAAGTGGGLILRYRYYNAAGAIVSDNIWTAMTAASYAAGKNLTELGCPQSLVSANPMEIAFGFTGPPNDANLKVIFRVTNTTTGAFWLSDPQALAWAPWPGAMGQTFRGFGTGQPAGGTGIVPPLML